jgi:hypothetical protein
VRKESANRHEASSKRHEAPGKRHEAPGKTRAAGSSNTNNMFVFEVPGGQVYTNVD